jgi:hypothetical protein
MRKMVEFGKESCMEKIGEMNCILSRDKMS